MLTSDLHEYFLVVLEQKFRNEAIRRLKLKGVYEANSEQIEAECINVVHDVLDPLFENVMTRPPLTDYQNMIEQGRTRSIAVDKVVQDTDGFKHCQDS